MFRGELKITVNSLSLLNSVKLCIKECIVDPQSYLSEELNETAVAIVAKAEVLGPIDQTLKGDLVEAKIEDGIHHSWHRKLGP